MALSEVLPLPGSPPADAAAAAVPTDAWASLALAHRVLGDITGTLTIVLAIWLAMSGGPSWLRNLGWAALAIVVAEAFLGIPSALEAGRARWEWFTPCLRPSIFRWLS